MQSPVQFTVTVRCGRGLLSMGGRGGGRRREWEAVRQPQRLGAQAVGLSAGSGWSQVVLVTQDVTHSPQAAGGAVGTDLCWSACCSALVQLETHTRRPCIRTALTAQS